MIIAVVCTMVQCSTSRALQIGIAEVVGVNPIQV